MGGYGKSGKGREKKRTMPEGSESESFFRCSSALLPKTSQKKPERLLQVEDIHEPPVPQQNLKYWGRFWETERVIIFSQYLEEMRENLQVSTACILDILFLLFYCRMTWLRMTR